MVRKNKPNAPLHGQSNATCFLCCNLSGISRHVSKGKTSMPGLSRYLVVITVVINTHILTILLLKFFFPIHIKGQRLIFL